MHEALILKPQAMKTELGMNGLVVMYVGNLEPYQGIDLLLQSFSLAALSEDSMDLVIIGGNAHDIDKYRVTSRQLGIDAKVHFLGPKPLELLPILLSEADILVSPRTTGSNTPMKIYPYLLSGKAVLATNLQTHTQILDESVAMLAEPAPRPFSEAMLCLLRDTNKRNSLGMAAKAMAQTRFSYSAFRTKLNKFLDWLETEIVHKRNGHQSKRLP